MKEWFEGDSVHEQPRPLIIPVGIWLAVIIGVISGLVLLSRGIPWT